MPSNGLQWAGFLVLGVPTAILLLASMISLFWLLWKEYGWKPIIGIALIFLWAGVGVTLLALGGGME